MPAIKHAPLAAIDPVTLYKILMLRIEVFVHEQRLIDEPELDGVDLEPFTELYWIEENNAVVATLRLINDGDPAHIGRVATARSARGRGRSHRGRTVCNFDCGRDISAGTPRKVV